MSDFNIKTYMKLMNALIDQDFSFSTFKAFISNPEGRQIVLRHDVDALPQNSLQFAEILAEKGLMGTFFFRIGPQSFNEKIIKEIFSMGHEVGYHYEDLSFVQAKLKAQGSSFANASADKAGHRAQGEELEKLVVNIGIKTFRENLRNFRNVVPVTTICMHGSPMSKWDSRLLWKYYDYHDFGIIGEPYFDIDFDKVMYLTDTGRRWDGDSFNVRDKTHDARRSKHGCFNFEDWKVKPKEKNNRLPDTAHCTQFPKFHSTSGIIRAAEEGKLPDKFMMTFHPQRWTDKPVPWIKELIWQDTKNMIKYFLVKLRP